MHILSTPVPTQYSANFSQTPLFAQRVNQQQNVTAERRDTIEIPIENYEALIAIDSHLKNMEKMFSKMEATLKESLQIKEKEYEKLKQDFEDHKKICKKEFQVEEKQDNSSKPGFKEEIIQQLKDPAWEIRQKAIDALRNLLGSSEETKKYITPLLKDKDCTVRETVLSAVGYYFSAEQTQQELIPLLKDPEWKIRQMTMNLLCDRLSRSEIEQKIIPLLEDPAWQVRQTAIDVLYKRLLYPLLKEKVGPLLQDPAKQVRQIANQVLREV